jgi:hypothetical protein
MSRTFIFRPLDSNEAFRWSWTSSLEARSPFEYSIFIESWPFLIQDAQNGVSQGRRQADPRGVASGYVRMLAKRERRERSFSACCWRPGRPSRTQCACRPVSFPENRPKPLERLGLGPRNRHCTRGGWGYSREMREEADKQAALASGQSPAGRRKPPYRRFGRPVDLLCSPNAHTRSIVFLDRRCSSKRSVGDQLCHPAGKGKRFRARPRKAD